MRKPLWIALIIALILSAPIAVYIHTFGTTIYARESAWATMGAAMSGLYGPILSVLTLAVLVIQVQLQRQTTALQGHTTDLQRQATIHMFDQAHIDVSRADVEFYLEKIIEVFAPPSQGEMLRNALHEKFAKATIEELESDELREEAALLDNAFPQLQASWASLNSIIGGLQAESRIAFQLQLVSAQQKAIVMLSHSTCASLDNYIRCLTEGKIAFPYVFSTTLSKG